MLKKILVLGAAVAALVALAAPVAQAQFKFTTNGVAITSHDVVTFDGVAGFALTSGAAGADATVEATLTVKAGTVKVGEVVGSVTEFHVSDCTGTGALAGTTCTPTTTEQNWPVTLRAQNTLEIGVNLHQLYWAGPHTGTPVATTLLLGGVTVEITPANISTGVLSPGNELTANGAEATVEGTLHKTGANVLSLD